ncbi:MAG: hypothetical protein V2J55_16500, partial [Candidatus Competibacteraceae bacterium]|nr:hypothetical protein [Candidatus Competibacteraceae bacterium]
MKDDGYRIVEGVLSLDELVVCDQVTDKLAGKATRRLLEEPQISALAAKLVSRIDELGGSIPVIASYLPKSSECNWFVASHRDELLPIARFHEGRGWSRKTLKEGIPHAKPPRKILESCLNLRIQLDSTAEGALTVWPGSHKGDEYDGSPRLVPISRRQMLLMSPLLKHASGKLKGSSEKRRVIQIVYGPAALPEPFRW